MINVIFNHFSYCTTILITLLKNFQEKKLILILIKIKTKHKTISEIEKYLNHVFSTYQILILHYLISRYQPQS